MHKFKHYRLEQRTFRHLCSPPGCPYNKKVKNKDNELREDYVIYILNICPLVSTSVNKLSLSNQIRQKHLLIIKVAWACCAEAGVEDWHLFYLNRSTWRRWWRWYVCVYVCQSCTFYITDSCIGINLTCLFSINLTFSFWLSCLIKYTLPGPLTSKLLHHKQAVQLEFAEWLCPCSVHGSSDQEEQQQSPWVSWRTLFKFWRVSIVRILKWSSKEQHVIQSIVYAEYENNVWQWS